MKRKLDDLNGISKNGSAVTEERLVGIGVEMGLRKSISSPPLLCGDVDAVYLRKCDLHGTPLEAELTVELPESSQELIILFCLATRVVLLQAGLNLARVDVRRDRDGADGFHDLVGDFSGVVDAVGEVKCRKVSLDVDGKPYVPHSKAICEGVLSDYDAVRKASFPNRRASFLVLCTMSRHPGSFWIHQAIRVAICFDASWYSMHQWPGLPQWRSPWSHGRDALCIGSLPSSAELRAKMLALLVHPLPEPNPEPAPASAQQPAQQPAQPAQPVVVFTAVIPQRKSRLQRHPRSWGEAEQQLAFFDGKPSCRVCMASDLLYVLRRDNNHVAHEKVKWKRTVDLIRDSSHCFTLGGPYSGRSGSAPLVLTEQAARAVAIQIYKLTP